MPRGIAAYPSAFRRVLGIFKIGGEAVLQRARAFGEQALELLAGAVWRAAFAAAPL